MSAKVFIVAQLPGWVSLESKEAIIEKVRETAWPQPSPVNHRELRIEWEAPSEWELRGIVQRTLDEVDAEWRIELYPGDLDRLMPEEVGDPR